MSFLKSLFVSEKNIGKLVDAGINAGDKIFYTEEEKAENRIRVSAWYLDLLAAMKPFNVAMRLLAIGVFAAWLIHLVASTTLYLVSPFVCSGELCSVLKAAELLEMQLGRHINDHFSTIIMFYFGAAGINSIVSTARGSKS